MKLAGDAPRHLSDTERERQRFNAALRRYEGLIFTTAQQLVSAGVELDRDDVQQLLRIKVWRAIRAYNPAKARGMDERRYVFMCVSDAKKDIGKKKRRHELLIEDIAPSAHNSDDAARDRFDERYLSEAPEETYGQVEDAPPHLPNTLSERERAVLLQMYRGFKQTEIAGLLGITKREVESAVRGLRTKLADWRPDVDTTAAPTVATCQAA